MTSAKCLKPEYQPETAPTAEIILDERLQARASLNPATIKQYAEAYRSGSEIPPIRLARIEGALYLVSGWHRLKAQRDLGRREVDAEVAEMTHKQAMWEAAQANLTNGLPLKAKEWREVFKMYVRAGQHRHPRGHFKSYREMAKDIPGKGYTTIRNWMQKDFPKVFRAIGGDEGGNVDPKLPGADATEMRRESAQEHLEQVTANYRALSCEEARGEIIADMEEALAEMRKVPFTPRMPPEF